MVIKLEVGDKAFIVESNRIVREVFILKRSRDFYTVRFAENASGGIQQNKQTFCFQGRCRKQYAQETSTEENRISFAV